MGDALTFRLFCRHALTLRIDGGGSVRLHFLPERLSRFGILNGFTRFTLRNDHLVGVGNIAANLFCGLARFLQRLGSCLHVVGHHLVGGGLAQA